MGRKRSLPRVLGSTAVSRLFEELDRATGSLTGLRDRALVQMLVGCGLRVSEIVALRGRDVDLQAATVRVVDGKGGKDRVVPMDGETLAWQQAWAVRRSAALGLNGAGAWYPRIRSGRTAPASSQDGQDGQDDGTATAHGAPPHDAAAPRGHEGGGRRIPDGGDRGQALGPRAVQNLVARLGERAGLEEPLHPHVLRHTYATRMLRRGLTVVDVSRLLGHEDAQTTLIYTHCVLDDDLVARINGDGQISQGAQLALEHAGVEGEHGAPPHETAAPRAHDEGEPDDQGDELVERIAQALLALPRAQRERLAELLLGDGEEG